MADFQLQPADSHCGDLGKLSETYLGIMQLAKTWNTSSEKGKDIFLDLMTRADLVRQSMDRLIDLMEAK